MPKKTEFAADSQFAAAMDEESKNAYMQLEVDAEVSDEIDSLPTVPVAPPAGRRKVRICPDRVELGRPRSKQSPAEAKTAQSGPRRSEPACPQRSKFAQRRPADLAPQEFRVVLVIDQESIRQAAEAVSAARSQEGCGRICVRCAAVFFTTVGILGMLAAVAITVYVLYLAANRINIH